MSITPIFVVPRQKPRSIHSPDITFWCLVISPKVSHSIRSVECALCPVCCISIACFVLYSLVSCCTFGFLFVCYEHLQLFLHECFWVCYLGQIAKSGFPHVVQGVCMRAKSLQLCPTLCDPMDYIAHQAPLSMGFSSQQYWSGLSGPPPGDLPNPGIEPVPLCLLHWQAGSLLLAPTGKPFSKVGRYHFTILTAMWESSSWAHPG